VASEAFGKSARRHIKSWAKRLRQMGVLRTLVDKARCCRDRVALIACARS
jgi:hypothetical protein